ncbi:M23 family metallopeptidase [Mesorhizobium sp. CU2]|uniref:M23 family metallopeptidase n=1 Tax=unclassified Mesorhizobium TaxID=325217 RepID=UPI0011262E4B|nr:MULTISPECIES: M23 family metallopeptidase [unclassified Mesorhizobium]TPN89421.1 M23 family metallopeptidase [Mesorhizobium sp. CU3]TPO22215.1 M23 family metallopeptidase [Mesorhizobium sp. CU2]
MTFHARKVEAWAGAHGFMLVVEGDSIRLGRAGIRARKRRGEACSMAVPIAPPVEGKPDAGSPSRSSRFRYGGIDLSYGPLRGIHWRERIVRFSMRTHARLALAVLLASVGATGAFLGTLRVAVRPAAVAQAVPATPQRVKQVSTAKGDRLPPPKLANRDATAALVEAEPDGSADEFTYRRVKVSLGELADNATDDDQPLLYQDSEPPAKTSPFDVLLARPGLAAASLPSPTAWRTDGRTPTMRSVPINVSTAAEQPPPQVERVAAMPNATKDVDSLLAAAGVSETDRHALADAWSNRTLDPSDHLDLIMERPASPDRPPRLAAVRFHRRDEAEMFLARSDDGSFRRLASRELYDRIAAEAADVDCGAAHPDRQPSQRRLGKAKVPADVSAEIVNLARANGLSADKTAGRSMDLIFRTGTDGRSTLISATFHGGDGDKIFYRYQPSATGQAEFFDEQGRSVSKMLMAKPVANGRLGDGFAWRVHPILKRWLHHNGVDYAAPYNSPIVAAGDGRVVKIGWESGYGKYVRLQHDGDYFTTYAHISRVPSSLKVGQRVKQGQTIAYIGSTGLSTGPHLYYELRIGGRYYDPTATRLSAGTRLTGDELEAFRRQIDHVTRISRYIERGPTVDGEAGAAMAPAHS